MKLPQNYFENLSADRYKSYLKLLPNMQHENTRVFTMLIMTCLAVSIIGFFAINPTLSTIFQLNKELSDTQFTHQQLKQKISNLSILQQKYSELSPDLTFMDDAIPHTPQAPLVMAQIESLAKDAHLTISTIHIATVQLASTKDQPDNKISSYIFSLQAQGTYDNMLQFANSLTQFNRLITIESMSIGKDNNNGKLFLDLRGRQFFKQ